MKYDNAVGSAEARARPRHYLRSILVNTALLVLSLTLAIVGVGGVLRFIDGVPLFEFKNYARDYIDQFNRFRSSMFDEQLGWRPKPYLHLVRPIKDVIKTETTDAYGTRINGEGTSGIATGGILAVGDSLTYGADVGDDELWPAYLQDMVGIPVTNAASQGWGIDQIVMRAEDMIDQVHPRTAIVGVYPPDIQRSELEIDFGAYKPYYTVESGNLVLHGVPVPHLNASIHDLGWEQGVLGYSYVAFWIARRLQRWSTFNYTKQATTHGAGEEVTCLLLSAAAAHRGRENPPDHGYGLRQFRLCPGTASAGASSAWLRARSGLRDGRHLGRLRENLRRGQVGVRFP